MSEEVGGRSKDKTKNLKAKVWPLAASKHPVYFPGCVQNATAAEFIYLFRMRTVGAFTKEMMESSKTL